MIGLLYEFINKESNFGMKKTQYGLLEGNIDQEFAKLIALHGPSIVFDNSLL